MTLTRQDVQDIVSDGRIDANELRELAEHALTSSHPLRPDLAGVGSGAAEVMRNLGLADGPVMAVQRIAWHMPEPHGPTPEESSAALDDDLATATHPQSMPVMAPVLAGSALGRFLAAGNNPIHDALDKGRAHDASATTPANASWRLMVFPPSIRPSTTSDSGKAEPSAVKKPKPSVYALPRAALRGYSPAQQSNQPGLRPVQLLKNDPVTWRRQQRLSRAPQRIMMPEAVAELMFVRIDRPTAPSFAAAPAPSLAGARPRPNPYGTEGIQPLPGEVFKLTGTDHAWRPGLRPGIRVRSPWQAPGIELAPSD
ncbi:MAG: hypothetical protein IPI58_08045 [Alphaproteobacteria bacterium]|nr:MAG: hypothetical protein IPI58_08045 [Alphaproteobacteria bacterium]